MKDIDDVTLEISKAVMGEDLEKRLPPKVLYRLRNWIKGMRQKANLADPGVQVAVRKAIEAKVEEMEFSKTLAKSDVGVSAYSNGAVKMIFGEQVSPRLKKMALEWATKRGLKPVEVSLSKSEAAAEEAIFGTEPELGMVCVKRVKFSE